MMDSLSEMEMAESDIIRRAEAQIKAYLGGQKVEVIGLMPPDGQWHESAATQPCGVCDNGRSLEKLKPSICLKCLRADKKFDRVLKASAKWEQRMLAMQSVIAEARIKRNATMQRRKGRWRQNHQAIDSDAALGRLQKRIGG
jgi:hypothetical protein